jgi:alpha-galactosidase
VDVAMMGKMGFDIVIGKLSEGDLSFLPVGPEKL